ncbi:MAG TPA: phosphatase PAP2 family protein [Candidatus Dormibacteraeota bacterium]|nr:phosphatase PAP2 family protein [Candidatus Dormibacteraeota bacterium]
MSHIAGVITRPHTRGGFVRWPLMALGMIGLATFAVLTLYATGHSYMPFDVSLERWIQGVSWGPLVTVFYWFDWLEGTRQYVAGIGVIVVVSAFNWKNAPLMLVAAASTAVYTVTELAIRRPRPSADLVRVLKHTGSFSYPSGHMVFFSWAVVLLVVCLVLTRAPRFLTAAAWVVAALVLAAAAIGRIYLGEHWPSDVMAGLALGLGWTALALSIRLLSNPALARSR